MTNKLKATQEEFQRYRAVQLSGAFNMLTPQARMSTGIDKTTYLDIISKYEEYIKAYGQTEVKEK